jgi:hypothetical protein
MNTYRQKRLHSLMESMVNVVVGMLINFTAQLIIYPLMGINVSLNTNIVIMLLFTIVSVARSYAIRRWFNWVM